jgi:hypothetical protein
MPPQRIHLVPGDSIRLTIDREALGNRPVMRMADGTEVYLNGHEAVTARARTESDILREGITRLVQRRGIVRKGDLKRLLLAVSDAGGQIDIT